MGMQTDKVRLNVGGKIFETTATTLASAGRSSMFGALFDDEWNLRSRQVNDEHFIDRNPDCFSVLLDLLRTGELDVPPHITEKKLYKEALYYGLVDHVRAARFCDFDRNRLRLTSSIKGEDSGDTSAIRASPDGGCAVAHDRIVRVYDWMMEEYPSTINLNYRQVNDICWIDSDNIMVSACQRSGRQDSGIGVFSSSRGDLKHTFQLNHENQVKKSFTAGALCHNSDGKVFAACSGTGINGIGIWDEITGKQTDFFNYYGRKNPTSYYDRTEYQPLCSANKIQCWDGNNCLLIFNLSRDADDKNDRKKRYVSLLDVRDRSMVWHVHENKPESSPFEWYMFSDVVDGIAMEGSNSICMLGKSQSLGFMDIRSTDGKIRWNSSDNNNNNRRKKASNEETVAAPGGGYPKLTLHEGQLYSCMNDRISMFSGPDLVLTSSLRTSGAGGAIRDFSIGGDRLFALHSDENVFDVWETPNPAV